MHLLGSMLSHFSRVWLFATLWTVAFQAPLSMGFSKQEYWSGLPCPSPGIRKEEKSKIGNLSFYFRKWEKNEKIKFKVNRRKEIVKIREEIKEVENKELMENSTETKS